MPFLDLSNYFWECQRKKPIKIMIFTEGTILGPKNKLLFYFCSTYVPIGACANKIQLWENQGAEIIYLTSRKKLKKVKGIAALLGKYHFCGTRLYYREGKQSYKDIVEEVTPDILIEDDCSSIGGTDQMCITHVKPEIKCRIQSVVTKEFMGIDHVPDKLENLSGSDKKG